MGANGVYDCNKASPLKKTINADTDDPARRPTRLTTMYWRICKFTKKCICVAKLKKVKIASSSRIVSKFQKLIERIDWVEDTLGWIGVPW